MKPKDIAKLDIPIVKGTAKSNRKGKGDKLMVDKVKNLNYSAYAALLCVALSILALGVFIRDSKFSYTLEWEFLVVLLFIAGGWVLRTLYRSIRG